jgi:beta-lactam-binding protein with PASTA domain
MKNIFKKILISIIAAIVILVIIFIVVFKSLDKYTLHGESVTVPEIREMSVSDAGKILNREQLNIEIIDSIFTLDKKPGIIIEQNPAPNSKIKKNRKVYVVINSITRKKVSFPEIKEHSDRQAKTILESVGFNVPSIEYIPAEFQNLVQYAKVDGKIINTGDEIPVGSNVVLVVGQGLSKEMVNMPSFRALTLEAAKQKSIETNIHLGSIRYDVQPEDQNDIKNYFIYKQSPLTGAPVNIGKYIDVWLTKDKSKLEKEEELYSNEDIDLEGIINDIENSFKYE